MFIVTEKVLNNNKLVGFGGFVVDKQLSGNIIKSSKLYITKDLAKYFANNFYLGCFTESDINKVNDGIKQFSNFGLVGLNEKGELNFVDDITYIKKSTILGCIEPTRCKPIDAFNIVEDVKCIKTKEWLKIFGDDYGFSKSKDKTVRLMLTHVSNSVIHLCRDLLITEGYTIESCYIADCGDVTVLEATTCNGDKNYKKIYIKSKTLKPYTELYEVIGVTNDKTEGLCLTCEINDLALCVYNATKN